MRIRVRVGPQWGVVRVRREGGAADGQGTQICRFKPNPGGITLLL